MLCQIVRPISQKDAVYNAISFFCLKNAVSYDFVSSNLFQSVSCGFEIKMPPLLSTNLPFFPHRFPRVLAPKPFADRVGAQKDCGNLPLKNSKKSAKKTIDKLVGLLILYQMLYKC